MVGIVGKFLWMTGKLEHGGNGLFKNVVHQVKTRQIYLEKCTNLGGQGASEIVAVMSVAISLSKNKWEKDV